MKFMKIKNFTLSVILLTLLIHCSTYAANLEDAIKLINMGKYDEAIKLLETNGEQNDILLAIAYLGKKDFQTAKIFALQYWLQNESNILANYILAFISEELKDYATASFYWNNVLRYAKDANLKRLAKRHIEVLKKISEGK